ncbi:MAG: (2Fe-2S)-binding protein [Pseudomonadota bacterium]
MKAIGGLPFLKMSQEMKEKLETPLASVEAPPGNEPSALIWQEILQRLKDQWPTPVEHEELCHCRRVLTETVDRAIVYGANTVEKVRQRTSANTGCGTCLEDVKSLLERRVPKK